MQIQGKLAYEIVGNILYVYMYIYAIIKTFVTMRLNAIHD